MQTRAGLSTAPVFESDCSPPLNKDLLRIAKIQTTRGRQSIAHPSNFCHVVTPSLRQALESSLEAPLPLSTARPFSEIHVSLDPCFL